MDTSSETSSLGKEYDDGVYDKVEAQTQYEYTPRSQSPIREQTAPKLPVVILTCLVFLFIFCFIGILVSGLHFGHRINDPGNCLGQSWVMFSSLLGLLYIGLHLQAARKGEPVNRRQPASQNPLHSGAIVIARLDTIAWAISLIIAAVAVSKDPVAVSCVNLVACTAVTPTIFFILCIDEKADRPFDLPYLTPPISSGSSIITCRVSDLVATMREVAVEDSISRRGSNHSTHSTRGNSQTQHAAAIAAAHSTPGTGGGLSGPRPPPSTVKEARPWGFDNFDERTKKELAASVTEASQASDARTRIGGPRALPLSEKALHMGVLPPPVCFEPKYARQLEADKENVRNVSQGSTGSWRKDWSALAAETGYTSAATTPASTPGIGPTGSLRGGSNRCLSPVAEVDDRRLSAIAAAQSAAANTYRYNQQQRPSQASSSPTRSLPPKSYTYAPAPARQYNSASVPRPPPPAATASSARIRLARAQEALKVRGGARDTVVLLNRPRRLTGDRKAPGQQPQAPPRAPEESRPELLRMPGSFEDD